MRGTDTPQSQLDFQRTVFPTLSIWREAGESEARLSVQTHVDDGVAFDDVV